MIKNKKYTHTKGGRFDYFDFTNSGKNSKGVSKKSLYFELKLRDNTIRKFKISPHTFAHFDEFKFNQLNEAITKFTHIMQYFAAFIFLLNSMELTVNDLQNFKSCKNSRLENNNF